MIFFFDIMILFILYMIYNDIIFCFFIPMKSSSKNNLITSFFHCYNILVKKEQTLYNLFRWWMPHQFNCGWVERDLPDNFHNLWKPSEEKIMQSLRMALQFMFYWPSSKSLTIRPPHFLRYVNKELTTTSLT